MACDPASQWMISADPNCPGMGGDAFLNAFMSENLQGPPASGGPLDPLGDPAVEGGMTSTYTPPVQFGPAPGETFILAGSTQQQPTYETSPQTGAMLLTPLAAPAAESSLLTGEEVLGGLLAKTFVPSGGALGPSLFESLIAGTTFAPGAAAEAAGGAAAGFGPLLFSIPAALEPSITPEVIAQTGMVPPNELAGTLDIADLFGLNPNKQLETQAELTPPPLPDVRPVASLTQDQLAQPTPNIGTLVSHGDLPANLQTLVAYDPTGNVGGLPYVVQPAPQPQPKPATAAVPEPARTADPVAVGAPAPAVLPRPSPRPATQSPASTSPVLTTTTEPSTLPKTLPKTQPQLQPFSYTPKDPCFKEPKKKKKSKERQVCHTGTYVEHTKGLSKTPRRVIKCQ